MGYLSDYFTLENVTAERTALAYASAFGVVACSVTVLISIGHGIYLGQKLGMMVRIVTTAAIYQKVDILCTIALSVIAQVSTGFEAETGVTEQPFYWSRDKPGLK